MIDKSIKSKILSKNFDNIRGYLTTEYTGDNRKINVTRLTLLLEDLYHKIEKLEQQVTQEESQWRTSNKNLTLYRAFLESGCTSDVSEELCKVVEKWLPKELERETPYNVGFSDCLTSIKTHLM